jgi:hypothetical protein
VLSTLGSPFVLLPLTVLLVSLRTVSATRALAVAGAFVSLAIAPLVILIRHRVRRGRWSDRHVSDRSHRREFYPIAIGVSVGTAVGLWLFGAPGIIVRGTLVVLLLLILGSALSQWSKISLHATIGAFCTVTLVTVNMWVAVGAVVLMTAVGWARIWLERHTVWQVLVGAGLGAAGGVMILRSGP